MGLLILFILIAAIVTGSLGGVLSPPAWPWG
jgi:hypothetical protein